MKDWEICILLAVAGQATDSYSSSIFANAITQLILLLTEVQTLLRVSKHVEFVRTIDRCEHVNQIEKQLLNELAKA